MRGVAPVFLLTHQCAVAGLYALAAVMKAFADADQMKERPELGQGELKTLANQAGNTEFVAPH
jgi:hypothetical protein